MDPTQQENSITVGDVVRLKSGGPKMTISTIGSEPSANAMCNWFDATDTLKSVSFKVSTLELADKRS